MGLWGIYLIIEILSGGMLQTGCRAAGWPQGHGVVTSVSNLNDIRPLSACISPCQREASCLRLRQASGS